MKTRFMERDAMRQGILVLAAMMGSSAAAVAGVTPVYSLVNPGGWSVGTALSTSQDWAATASDHIDGAPNVGFNDAGAGLAEPVLSVESPGFVAGSGGFYSFSGAYNVVAALNAPSAGVPAGAGTYVIVQSFATIDPDDGLGHSGTVLGVTLTDASGNAIAGLQHLRSEVYGYEPHFASSFGDVQAQATIDEFWIPDFTGGFKAISNVIDDSSFQEQRIDSIVALPLADGGAPFALTVVPEPGLCGVLGLAAVALGRRGRKSRE